MRNQQSKLEFVALLAFLTVTFLVLSNGFVARIFAQQQDTDVFGQIEPIGEVLTTILDEYVKEPEINKVVEGALVGMMNSLDKHSSYISPESLRAIKEDTTGEFKGIGVSIRLDDDKNIVVFQPIPDTPASKAGIMAGDMIVKIDDVSTAGMALDDAAKRIRGPEGTTVKLTIFRRLEEGEAEYKEFTVKRESIPLESIKESRIIRDGIGYIRISDFKDNTAKDLARNIEQLLGNGMTSLILDLRWNPGGLLSASKEACELFLPKNTLVTYTKGRNSTTDKKSSEDLRLYTERSPVLPENFPLVVLVNEQTASSAEIVTGALQFWAKAIIVGQTTYGKGSVQTIIPLSRPPGSALRLTTALYYTPAEVTIDSAGIKPDVEAPLSRKQQVALLRQMYESIRDDASRLNSQNHGAVTGEKPTEGSVEDVQLKRAVEILAEDPVFEKLLTKYHKDTHETQVAASPDKVLQQGRVADERDIELDEPLEEEPAPEDKPSNEPVPAEP